MPNTDIVFLDIPTTRGAPVSPYTWRVRLYLNCRGFHYKTRWIATVDIEAESRSLDIPPTKVKPSGEPLYTLPAILDYTFSDLKPTAVSDSFRILRYLEQQYPPSSPSIFPTQLEPQWASFNTYVDTQILVLGGSLFLDDLARSKVPRDLGPFKSRMEALFGGKWEDLSLKRKAREATWKKLENNMASLMERFGAERCFLVGDTVSYPDFVVCGCLIWLRNIVSDEDWRRIAAWNGKWRELLRVFDAWISVDQHPNES
ncbi:hypothetical protein C0991_008003 [Blastosporella zonata]|nr:hypothetical protein C0991_008003 [Blastosporella zonata]